MRIQDVMTTEIISISRDAVVNDAREVLRRNRIHHLIVLDGKKIIGVISDRDLADRDGDTPVADVMTTSPAREIHPRQARPEDAADAAVGHAGIARNVARKVRPPSPRPRQRGPSSAPAPARSG